MYYAAWSPDGRRIAYQQCNWQPPPGCELRVATLAGESDVVFRNEAGYSVVPAGWLPDGSALVVALDRADKTLSIGLVPTAGGSFTALRSISGWAGIYPEPVSVSPDRGWIAFTEGSPRDIHVISPDGRTARRITNHPADDHRPLWSPDGRHLAFLSTRNGNTALWTVAIRDGQPAAEPVRVKDGMQDATLRSWTARGLAYSESSRTTDIYTVPVDPASGEPIGSPRQIPYGRTGRNVGPRWSPDGKYLAFVSSSPAEPDRRAVVLLPSGGGAPREFPIPTSVYRSADSPGELRWFGDSRGLGFHGYDPRGERTLFRLTLATGDWKTFPFPVPLPGAGIEWDVDGSRYYYNSNFQNPTRGPGGNRIVERDLQSDRERVVFRGNEKGFDYYLGFKFSPDRRLLAFRSDQGIWILDVETGEARRVHDDVQETPTWSPNGRALLVPRTETPQTDKQVANLRLIPVDGGEVRQIPLGAELTRLLSSSRGTQRPMSSLAWSPDGGRLAFVLRARRDETLVLENPLALASALEAGARK